MEEAHPQGDDRGPTFQVHVQPPTPYHSESQPDEAATNEWRDIREMLYWASDDTASSKGDDSSRENDSHDSHAELQNYEPPEALSMMPDDISSELLVAVVQSSLANVCRREGNNPTTPNNGPAASPKGKEKAVTKETDPATPNPGPPWEEPKKPPPRRPRFGLSRILRHVKEDAHTGWHAPGPTSFTQFVYKHLKPAAPQAGDLVECVSCLEDIQPNDAIKTACHHYCNDCFGRLVRTAVDNEALWPPKCCLTPVSVHTIAKYAAPDLLEAYRAKDEELKTPAESRVYCSHPDCGVWIPLSPSPAQTARCSQGHDVCVACRQPAHASGARCPGDRDQQLTEQLAQQEGWKRCHNCSALVEHRAACQHMTCRCGAQFCYVCGARWRTCDCTLRQLDDLKCRADARREQREARELAEDAELRVALHLVARMEAEDARREERRRQKRERKREAARRAAVADKFRDARIALARLHSLQRAALDKAHWSEATLLTAREGIDTSRLQREQFAARDERRRVAAARRADRELEWDRDYRVRIAWERRLEDEYEAVLDRLWAAKPGGPERTRTLVLAYRRKNDARLDAWRRWKDAELHRFAQALEDELEDELAVEAGAAEEARRELDEELAARSAAFQAKRLAEQRWFELVFEERERLMGEWEEREEREEKGT